MPSMGGFYTRAACDFENRGFILGVYCGHADSQRIIRLRALGAKVGIAAILHAGCIPNIKGEACGSEKLLAEAWGGDGRQSRIPIFYPPCCVKNDQKFMP